MHYFSNRDLIDWDNLRPELIDLEEERVAQLLGQHGHAQVGFGEGESGGGGSFAMVVGDHLDRVVLPDRDLGVGRSEIDCDRFFIFLFLSMLL